MGKLSVFHKLGWSSSKRSHHYHADVCNEGDQARWSHHGREITESFVVFNAKFLGSMEVSQPKGVDMVKDSIKKLKIERDLKKAEQGHKGSKLSKVEIVISIDAVKVVDVKNKNMICTRPLQRVSYCADDHRDKRLFAFIAKEHETKRHKCFVFVSEREAAEITLTLGEAFKLAYKRYLEKNRPDEKQNKESINIEKEITKLKEENVKLKQELEANKAKNGPQSSSCISNDTPSSFGDQPALNSEPTSRINSTLPTASCEVLIDSSTRISDITFNADFDKPLYHRSLNGSAVDDIDIFGSFDHVPTSFKKDPFADAPGWRNVADDEPMKQPVIIDQFINGNVPNNEPCGNPFAVSLELPNTHHKMNNDSNLDTNQLNERNSDPFSHYLSNVVAQRTSSNASLNCITGNPDLSYEDSVNHISIDSSLGQNSEHFNAYNEFGFGDLDLTNSSGNIMNELNDDGFFSDIDYIRRPKAHTITVLTAQNVPRFRSSNGNISELNMTADNVVKEVYEDDFFSSENLALQKTLSCGASYNQEMRPRLGSFSVSNQMFPTPPNKQSLKKPTCIKTPTLKVLSSTPLKENTIYRGVVPETKTRPSSSGFILPNVKSTVPAPEVDIRPRSRSRVYTLQDAAPLKESISQASQSLEDLCSISAQSSDISPPRNRTCTNPFMTTSPVSRQ